MLQLTEIHQKVLDYLVRMLIYSGYSPSFEEIMQNTGIKSKGHLEVVLARLEKHGKISRRTGKARGIMVDGVKPGLIQVPNLGKIAAGIGVPPPVDRSAQQFNWDDYPFVELPAADLPRLPSGSDFFALTVEGDSMIEDGVWDGDQVICFRPQGVQSTIPSGAMVAAWLVQEEVLTLKRLRKVDTSIWLIPANPAFQPREFKNPEKDLEIHGVVLKIIRDFKIL